MALSDYFPQMAGWKPVSLSAPSNAPQIPNDQTVRSAYLRTTLPLPLQYSGDTVKQYNSPGLSTFRIAPLPPSGLPTVIAAATGAAQVAIANSTQSLVRVELGIPGIFTPTTQTQSPDGSGLISLAFALAPEIGGTVFLTPFSGSGGGVYDNAVTQNGISSDPISIGGSTNANNEFAVYLTATDGAGPADPNPGAGWTRLSTASSPSFGIYETLYSIFVPVQGAVSISTINPGSDFSSILAFFGTNNAAPVLLQPTVITTHVAVAPTVALPAFANPNTAGSAIIVCVAGNSVTGLMNSPSVTDTQGNLYHLVANTNNLGMAGLCQAIMFVALNVKAGANTITFAQTGGAGDVSLSACEFSNVTAISSTPIFASLTGAFIPPIDLSVANINGGIKNTLGAGNGGTGLTSPGTSGNVLTSTGSAWVSSAPPAVTGGVASKSANYLITGSDAQKIISLASGSHTFQLPSSIPSAKFTVYVENVGGGTLTLDPNGLTLDGSASTVSIAQNQGMYIATDGSNYFSCRGWATSGSGLSLEVNGTPNGSQTLLNLIAGTNVTITDGGSGGVTIAASGGGGGSAFQTQQRHSFFVADGTTTTLQVAGDVFSNSLATAAAVGPTATKGAVVTYTSGGSNEIFLSSARNGGGINFNGGSSGNYVTGRNIKIQWKGYWGTAANADYWIGMFTGSNTGNDFNGIGKASDPASTAQASGVGFRCWNTSLGETVYQAYAGNGVTTLSTTASTGVTLDTSEHTWAIIFDDTVPNVKYYIDGTLVATITTNLPASAAPLWMLVSAHVASGMLYGFESCYIDCDI